MSTAKIDLPLSSDQEELIQHAAELSGKSVTEFAISVLTKSAKKIIRRNQLRLLSQKDWERFTEIVSKEEPNEALKQAAQEYQQQYEQLDNRKTE